MTQDRIHEIAETYIYGNISDAKADIKKMSKRDFIDLIAEISDIGGSKTKYDVLLLGWKLADL